MCHSYKCTTAITVPPTCLHVVNRDNFFFIFYPLHLFRASVYVCKNCLYLIFLCFELTWNVLQNSMIYRGADKSLARPTSRRIFFDGENISFDASLVIYIYILLIFLQSVPWSHPSSCTTGIGSLSRGYKAASL